jgi:hypothetical protein
MTTLVLAEPYYIRQRRLGSEAVYRVVDEDGRIVTAEVVRAPGLEPGTRVRLLARAVRAMERLEPLAQPAPLADPIAATRRFAPTGVH